mgnify:FL=1
MPKTFQRRCQLSRRLSWDAFSLHTSSHTRASLCGWVCGLMPKNGPLWPKRTSNGRPCMTVHLSGRRNTVSSELSRICGGRGSPLTLNQSQLVSWDMGRVGGVKMSTSASSRSLPTTSTTIVVILLRKTTGLTIALRRRHWVWGGTLDIFLFFGVEKKQKIELMPETPRCDIELMGLGLFGVG